MARIKRQRETVSILFMTIVLSLMAVASFIALSFAFSAESPIPKDTLFWFSFAFISGLLTIFLPCTMPLAFVTVPLGKERDVLASLGMVLLYALGAVSVLVLYGLAFGFAGDIGLGIFPQEALARIVPWTYLLGGMFAYALSLGELGLLSLRMPSYAGASPSFVRSRKGPMRFFALGAFLGNVGVGCPIPSMPLLLLAALLSGSPLYGALLFFIHAIGRILPLLILIALSTFEVNGLAWLVANKKDFDRAGGWIFVAFSAFLIALGSYANEWLYANKIYVWLAHALGIESSVSASIGVLGYLSVGGGWCFITLLLVPLWWKYLRDRAIVAGSPMHRVKRYEREIERLLEEQRGHEAALHLPEGKQHERVRELDRRIDLLLAERRIAESKLRHGFSLEYDEALASGEERLLRLERNWYATLTALVLLAGFMVIA